MELGSPDLQVDSFISWATREGPSFLGTALKNKRKTTTTATTTTKPLITWLKEHLKPDLEDFLNKNSDAVPLRRQGNYVRFNEKENKTFLSFKFNALVPLFLFCFLENILFFGPGMWDHCSPGIKPMPPTLEAGRLKGWTARQVPLFLPGMIENNLIQLIHIQLFHV